MSEDLDQDQEEIGQKLSGKLQIQSKDHEKKKKKKKQIVPLCHKLSC